MPVDIKCSYPHHSTIHPVLHETLPSQILAYAMGSILFDERSHPPQAIMNKQILVRVVDGMAHSQPFAVYAEYPYSSTSCEAGFRKVTYADFANVINGLAWKLKETLGPGEGFPTLAYIGPNDLRYAALTLACVKVGYKVFGTHQLPGDRLTATAALDISSQQHRRSSEPLRCHCLPGAAPS